MKFIKMLFCLALVAMGTSIKAQLQIDRMTLGTKLGIGVGKFHPISPVSSAQYQALDIAAMNSYFLEYRIAYTQLSLRYELGIAKLPTPSDYFLDMDAAFSSQLVWQSKSHGFAIGAGLRAALLLSIAGETSLYVYQRSLYELSVPLLVEKHWDFNAHLSLNTGIMTTASLTRSLGDCLWWENPNGVETTPCRRQIINGGLIYLGLLYKIV